MSRMSTLPFVTVLSALAATSAVARGQAGVGAKYGARDPRTCASRTVPARGAPSPAQVAQYMACGHEKELGGALYLLDQVQVTGVAAGRPYNRFEDRNMGDVDVRVPVYAIRGSYTEYSCSAVWNASSDRAAHAGSNCVAYAHPHATGLCNKDTFGDWHCSMSDRNAPEPVRYLPPPR